MVSAPTEAYTYDPIYQLTQVVQNGSTTTENYTYDPVGNRMSSLTASPWNYNVSNQLTAISGSPGTTFTYDNNGNTLTKVDSSGTTIYAWDYENRLASVTLPGSGGTVSFIYDPLGRRVRKQSTSATTIYAYDGENIVGETDASGALVARYAMGLSIDEPLAMLRSSGNRYKFTGKERDIESGLDYFGARYYASLQGRFVRPDPVVFSRLPENPQGLNKYAYCFGNPLNLVDPDGRWPLWLHRQIVADVFESYGPEAVAAINRGSDWVDSVVAGNQSARNSYMHSMRDGFRNHSVAAAAGLAINYIRDEVAAAVDIQIRHEGEGGTGYSTEALERLGHAVHTAIDATSPTHAGYQPWFGLYHPEGITHVRQESRIARSNESSAAEARYAARLEADRVKRRFEEELARRREFERRKKEEEEKKKKEQEQQ